MRLEPKTMVAGLEIDGTYWAGSLENIQQSASIQTEIAGKPIKITWDEELLTPRAFSGSQELVITQAYWFSWSATHPQTQLYSANN